MDDSILPRSFRDQAFLETLYSSGARVSEVVNLNLDDVDLHERIATVLGKGRKERIVPLGTHAVRALAAYRRSLPAGTVSCPLSRNQRGGRPTARSVAPLVATAAPDLPCFPTLSPPARRHSFGAPLLHAGV